MNHFEKEIINKLTHEKVPPVVKNRIRETLNSLPQKKTKHRFTALNNPLRIALLVGIIALLSGMAYAATGIIQLFNSEGKVVMELKHSDGDPYAMTSIEEIYNIINENEAVVIYETEKYPDPSFILLNKPRTYSDIEELNSASDQSYNFKPELPHHYQFVSGYIIWEQEPVPGEIRHELLTEAQQTNEKLIYRIISSKTNTLQLNTQAEYSNGTHTVIITTTDTTERYANMLYNAYHTAVEKIFVHHYEALYFRDEVRQSIEWISESGNNPKYFRIISYDVMQSKEELISLAEGLE